ncbi:hypothetical protein EV1_009824 [Malus domestica]
MEARVNTNSSSVWKSMAVAQPVLQKGLRWQVGDGRKIKIWHDQWLPRDSYFKVLSSPPSSWDKEATVNSVMLDALRQWNKWMLDSLFSQEEVSLITGPPLSLRPVEDHVIWHHERNGRFSVHNVYHIAKSIQVASGEGANGSSLSSNSEMEKFWKMLWHACVPGKVKIYVWKACLDSLLTRSNLIKCRVISDRLCLFCGSHIETMEHVLRDCSMVMVAWFYTVGVRIEASRILTLVHWLNQVVTPLLPTSFKLCLMTIWTLEKARNDALWSGITLPLQELLIRAKRWLSEYHKYHKPPKRAAGHGIKRWKKPTEG